MTPRTICFGGRYAYKTDVILREVGEAMINFEI